MAAFYKVKSEEGKCAGTHIIQHPFMELPMRALFLGPSQRSGKTTAIANLLCLPAFYQPYFEGKHVHIFSPTTDLDEKYQVIQKTLNIPDSNMHTNYTLAEIKSVFFALQEEHVKEPKKQFLIVLDDLGAKGALVRNPALNEIICRGRHSNINIFITAQSNKQFDTTVRKNASLVMLFNNNFSEMESAWEHYAEEERKVFRKIFKFCTQIPGQVLCIRRPTMLPVSYLWGHDHRWDDITPTLDDPTCEKRMEELRPSTFDKAFKEKLARAAEHEIDNVVNANEKLKTKQVKRPFNEKNMKESSTVDLNAEYHDEEDYAEEFELEPIDSNELKLRTKKSKFGI
jgi:hypothetical protein